jgi:hypothetical protein
LPALVNDMGAQTNALRRDWGRTLYELLTERFLAPVQDWAKKHGTRFRIQDYGVPAAAISSNAYADIPDGEGAQWKVVRAARWASSAAHLYSRPVTSSETWTWLHSPVFRATPLDVKAEADIHFLQGINQLIGHGWPYSAPGVEYPGWRFYASGVFNEKNPWWIVMPDLTKYLQRISFMMRQGKPANDVAVYLPNDDGWSHMQPGNPHLIEVLRERLGTDLMPAIFRAGYNLDFFDDDSFRQVGSVENGSVALGQNRYKIVILPDVETIPLDTYEKFEEFARRGGVLIATKRTPSEAPGYLATQKHEIRVAEISKRLFEGPSAAAHLVLDEKTQLGPTLNKLIPPTLALSGPSADVGFIKRTTGDADIYFVVNTANTPLNVEVKTQATGMRAEEWDPFTGNVKTVPTKDGAVLPLNLAPYQSRLLVFTKRQLSAKAEVQIAPDPIDLSNDWQVTIGSAPTVSWNKLHSWTDDPATRYFSGTANYSKDVNVSAEFLKAGLSVELDFGEGTPLTPLSLRSGMQAWLDGPIREAAVVYVNEKRAGAVWCPPYRIDVTAYLKSGSNRLRIQVANTAMNYMAGHRLPDYRLLNLRYGERFQPQDLDRVQTLPSGILGPVRLIASAR